MIVYMLLAGIFLLCVWDANTPNMPEDKSSEGEKNEASVGSNL